ncbi:OsmC family protein [Sinimarinibacterium flocculans]|uniref:Putative redox protein n=1 Tax=Sinimarinibacterium flocculans TaxID=985250 RepID=A0A318EBQ7_9GAMM|nr:OsmC family protein [Sinimarinibacterium flocculans]PXV67188.1 putative redox protein [Sinimarinibacterium flocculans]
MKACIKWNGEARFTATSGSGHDLVVDGPPEIGGRNQGPRPMELLLMGVGACSAVDVTLIMKKSRQQVSDCWVELEAQRAPTEPKVFTAIHMHFVVVGTALVEAHVKRAVQLSAEKYCSASIMLARGGVAITHDYELREA